MPSSTKLGGFIVLVSKQPRGDPVCGGHSQSTTANTVLTASSQRSPVPPLLATALLSEVRDQSPKQVAPTRGQGHIGSPRMCYGVIGGVTLIPTTVLAYYGCSLYICSQDCWDVTAARNRKTMRPKAASARSRIAGLKGIECSGV